MSEMRELYKFVIGKLNEDIFVYCPNHTKAMLVYSSRFGPESVTDSELRKH